MRENNFEDQVREKMDQFGFDPPDAIWTAVDKEINKDKKRRGPLFILILFSGLLLAGGVIYFGAVKNNSVTKTITGEQKRIDEGENKSSVGKDQSSKEEENKLNEETPNLNKQNMALKSKNSSKSDIVKSGNGPASSDNSKGIRYGRNDNSVETTVAAKSDKSNSEIIPPVAVETGSKNSGENKIDSSGLKKTIAPVLQITAPKDSNTESNLAARDKPKSKSSLWTFGLTGGAGISNTNQSLFKQSNVNGLYYSPASINGANFAVPVPVSSKINPGFSFTAGVFVSRYLSKRVSISAGLNYNYYSTHNKTGYRVDSSIIVYNPSYYYLGANTTPGAYAINNYYQSGSSHSYTNQYHFIELPVTADFQLNKSIKLPVYWEAGLSVSYLLSTNALYFDPNGNLYYQNELLFNKVQLNGNTAFMVGFPFDKNELRLGPELQYGFSGLLKSGSGNPQHLFYTGLKVSFIRGKK
jgi:Outer membrane protein beta-barrel domain